MQDFMQSLQMRWPVAQQVGLSITIIASAPIAQPSVFTLWNSEMRSSSGQPLSGTPKGLFLKGIETGLEGADPSAAAGAFSRMPFEQESLPCSWHQMQ